MTVKQIVMKLHSCSISPEDVHEGE